MEIIRVGKDANAMELAVRCIASSIDIKLYLVDEVWYAEMEEGSMETIFA